MKTVEIDGQAVVIMLERGRGDGWLNLRYFVAEDDGTYSMVGEGYDTPSVARAVFEKPDDEHLRWIVKEARRQTIAKDVQPPQEKRPSPTTLAEQD